MYARTFSKAAHTKRFIIKGTPSSGWVVREEEDTEVVRTALYTDWHRVERAMKVFTREAMTLRDSGWVEADGEMPLRAHVAN